MTISLVLVILTGTHAVLFLVGAVWAGARRGGTIDLHLENTELRHRLGERLHRGERL